MSKKKKNIEIKKEVWKAMRYRPKKIKCDKDTAKELRKVFGDKIMNDIEINTKEKKDEQDKH